MRLLNEKFNPQKDNPCWGCEYRKKDEVDFINVCLLDEGEECIRDREQLKESE